MNALPPTPLEEVPRPAAAGAGRLFFKREDLLPYGGGNKVPRFLHALGRRDVRRVAAFSDYGSHTFGALARMVADPALGLEAVEFYERPVTPDPYRRRVAKAYSETPGVLVRRGSQAGLLLRWNLRKLRRRPDELTCGIGGRVRGTAASYLPAARSCARQLEALRLPEGVVHVVAVSAADTARALRAGLRASGRKEDLVAGVLTGDPAAHLVLRLQRRRGVQLVRAPRITWEAYVELARACHAVSGVWLDPAHTIPAWAALGTLPDRVRERAIVFWVTCPRIESPPFDLHP